MFEWLSTAGAGLKNHVPGETNYLSRLKQGGQGDSNRPFPNNPNFVSESILSEDLREEIYKRVTSKKQSLRAVSVELGIDMKRIAAVVRLVELEKRQRSQVRIFLFLFVLHFGTFLAFAYDESKKIRLVLKTPTWLHLTFLTELRFTHTLDICHFWLNNN
jgi:hypothetical protein